MIMMGPWMRQRASMQQVGRAKHLRQLIWPQMIPIPFHGTIFLHDLPLPLISSSYGQYLAIKHNSIRSWFCPSWSPCGRLPCDRKPRLRILIVEWPRRNYRQKCDYSTTQSNKQGEPDILLDVSCEEWYNLMPFWAVYQYCLVRGSPTPVITINAVEIQSACFWPSKSL